MKCLLLKILVGVCYDVVSSEKLSDFEFILKHGMLFYYRVDHLVVFYTSKIQVPSLTWEKSLL